MKLLEISFETTAENLAADEVLLEFSEASPQPVEIMRLWENASLAVVVGRSSRVNQEINVPACQRRGIPIFRRSSGGAAVVIGPGCLMYSLVLDYRLRPHLKMLDQAHGLVMRATRQALSVTGLDIQFQGTCDLTLDNKKFSGNSLRCKRNALLYHGTILYDFPLDTIQECLEMPPRQPEYRFARHHEDFVTNVTLDRQQISQMLVKAWPIDGELTDWPRSNVGSLARDKYLSDEWTFRR